MAWSDGGLFVLLVVIGLIVMWVKWRWPPSATVLATRHIRRYPSNREPAELTCALNIITGLGLLHNLMQHARK